MFDRLKFNILMIDRNVKKVASRINVHPMTLYLWMQGKSKPRLKNLKKLADYLHRDIKEFMKGE